MLARAPSRELLQRDEPRRFRRSLIAGRRRVVREAELRVRAGRYSSARQGWGALVSHFASSKVSDRGIFGWYSPKSPSQNASSQSPNSHGHSGRRTTLAERRLVCVHRSQAKDTCKHSNGRCIRSPKTRPSRTSSPCATISKAAKASGGHRSWQALSLAAPGSS